VPLKILHFTMATAAPVTKPVLKRQTGKIAVDLLVATGVPIQLARQIIYKRQYAYAKKVNYKSQRKYEHKKALEKLCKTPKKSIGESKSMSIQEWHI